MNKILVPTVKKVTGNKDIDIENIVKFMSNAAVCLDEIIRFAPTKSEVLFFNSLKGFKEGLNVTIKDVDELYISGGIIDIGSKIYSSLVQLTVALGTIVADTMYYVYVNAPTIGDTLTATNFSISTTVPLFSNSLGAKYKTGDSTKRYVARYYEKS